MATTMEHYRPSGEIRRVTKNGTYVLCETKLRPWPTWQVVEEDGDVVTSIYGPTADYDHALRAFNEITR